MIGSPATLRLAYGHPAPQVLNTLQGGGLSSVIQTLGFVVKRASVLGLALNGEVIEVLWGNHHELVELLGRPGGVSK